MKLPVVESFFSLQGEGKRIGKPSLFLRLGGCNFSCRGFNCKTTLHDETLTGCDSLYAVHPKFKETWDYYHEPKSLIERLEDLAPNYKHFDFILTGGEPSLYFNNPILISVLEHFYHKKIPLFVESNGSIFFEFSPILKELHFTLSVKLSFSLEEESKRINLKALQNILNNAKSAHFKFVLESKNATQSIIEIQNLLKQLPLKNNEIFLMPLGATNKELDKNLKTLAPLALEHGFNLSDRLHIRLWDNQKGF
ncbi:7-carboxy-7-deazaguanine synthase QueE [Helicobacter pylori]|uniref:7-carboxy-7-deazaguanine synthase n=1 Tax=Helicobacter pylori 83 TaxID=585538 RepID=F4D6G4_HELPX|nr:7-carboxy-7-deazaguanine synthase QueE [Helicobacter pylori]AEE70589.1 radical SAM domain protein [Helicobacter pylori 83]BDA05267.1 7-carboxy-7-deazaguanine synthase [Helicobacter pylori]GHQ05641.1 7-carboxy-7-deazaguanine synthase [Helicobacter pylori]